MRIFSNLLSAHSLPRSDSPEPKLTQHHYHQSETLETENLHCKKDVTVTFFSQPMLVRQSRKDSAEKIQKTSHLKPKDELIFSIGFIRIVRAGTSDKAARTFPSFSAIEPKR